MDSYSGFEPAVGEIRALRSFRIGPDGKLYPLFHKQPWKEGSNTARCEARSSFGSPPSPTRSHLPPEPECGCGFYAYAFEPGESEYPYACHVLAVVACWGRVIAGTRGVRAEHSRIEALWMSEQVPPELAEAVATRYPSVRIYADKPTMLRDHPATRLDCYEPAEAVIPTRHPSAQRTAVLLSLIATSLPASWVGNTVRLDLIGASATLWLIIGLAAFRHPASRAAVKRRASVALAAVLWMTAPLAGGAGIVLIRLPLLQIALALYTQRSMLNRAARRFPAEIG